MATRANLKLPLLEAVPSRLLLTSLPILVITATIKRPHMIILIIQLIPITMMKIQHKAPLIQMIAPLPRAVATTALVLIISNLVVTKESKSATEVDTCTAIRVNGKPEIAAQEMSVCSKTTRPPVLAPTLPMLRPVTMKVKRNAWVTFKAHTSNVLMANGKTSNAKIMTSARPIVTVVLCAFPAIRLPRLLALQPSILMFLPALPLVYLFLGPSMPLLLCFSQLLGFR